ncbi:MAG: metallophosphoesterase family protein [candidate division NC10 bacterium]|nr:metallophosphoesterase family protein [candidate division NC10 bacterium]
MAGCREGLPGAAPAPLRDRRFFFVHSTPKDPERWEYILSLEDAEQAFSDFSGRICFVGHSHVPVLFLQEEGRGCRASHISRMELEPGFRYLVNVGSVGQPRDGDPRGSYVLFDPDEGRLELKRVGYDVARTQEKMVAAGLPYFLAARLAAGR